MSRDQCRSIGSGIFCWEICVFRGLVGQSILRQRGTRGLGRPVCGRGLRIVNRIMGIVEVGKLRRIVENPETGSVAETRGRMLPKR